MRAGLVPAPTVGRTRRDNKAAARAPCTFPASSTTPGSGPPPVAKPRIWARKPIAIALTVAPAPVMVLTRRAPYPWRSQPRSLAPVCPSPPPSARPAPTGRPGTRGRSRGEQGGAREQGAEGGQQPLPPHPSALRTIQAAISVVVSCRMNGHKKTEGGLDTGDKGVQPVEPSLARRSGSERPLERMAT